MDSPVRLQRGLTQPLTALLFAVGLLGGLALFGIVIWADFEAAMFSPGIQQDASLRSLRCPVMITRSQAGTVTASVGNPLKGPTDRYVRAHITDGYVTLMREVNRLVPLAPGETEQLEWTVTADDAAFERLILVQVVVRGRYPLPSRQGTCGIFVVDAPILTGNEVFAVGFGASLVSMAVEMGLWSRAGEPLGAEGQQVAHAMGMLSGGVLAGTTVGLLGWWLPGLILFVITLLGIGVIMGYFLNRV